MTTSHALVRGDPLVARKLLVDLPGPSLEHADMRYARLGFVVTVALCFVAADAAAQTPACAVPTARCAARQRDVRGCCPVRLPRACARQGGYEACHTACTGGSAEACEAAYYMGESYDAARANGAIIRACELGNNRACFRASRVVTHQRTPETYTRAVALLRGACARNHQHACWLAGRMLDLPAPGGARDQAAAIDLWTRGCEMGSPECCYESGHAALSTARDPNAVAAAEALVERSCQATGVDVDDLRRLRDDMSSPPTAAAILARSLGQQEARDRLGAIANACSEVASIARRRSDAPSQARATEAAARAAHCRSPVIPR